MKVICVNADGYAMVEDGPKFLWTKAPYDDAKEISRSTVLGAIRHGGFYFSENQPELGTWEEITKAIVTKQAEIQAYLKKMYEGA